jgi:hypothetical protein
MMLLNVHLLGEAQQRHIREPMGQSTPYLKSTESEYKLKNPTSNQRKRVYNTQAPLFNYRVSYRQSKTAPKPM